MKHCHMILREKLHYWLILLMSFLTRSVIVVNVII